MPRPVHHADAVRDRDPITTSVPRRSLRERRQIPGLCERSEPLEDESRAGRKRVPLPSTYDRRDRAAPCDDHFHAGRDTRRQRVGDGARPIRDHRRRPECRSPGARGFRRASNVRCPARGMSDDDRTSACAVTTRRLFCPGRRHELPERALNRASRGRHRRSARDRSRVAKTLLRKEQGRRRTLTRPRAAAMQ